MPQTTYKISEARKHFAEVLERANQGEEITIMRGNEVYARIGPAGGGKRPFGLLRQRGLPDDLFDEDDASRLQSTPATGMTMSASGGADPTAARPPNEGAARQPRGLLVDNRQ